MNKQKEIEDYLEEVSKLPISEEAKEMIMWDKYGKECEFLYSVK